MTNRLHRPPAPARSAPRLGGPRRLSLHPPLAEAARGPAALRRRGRGRARAVRARHPDLVVRVPPPDPRAARRRTAASPPTTWASGCRSAPRTSTTRPRPTPSAARLRRRAGPARFTLVVHDFGGPIALPLALDAAGARARLVLLNTWMWSFADDPDMRRGAHRGGRLRPLALPVLNFSLRVITPCAFGDRRSSPARFTAQYLAPSPTPTRAARAVGAGARAARFGAYYDALAAARAAARHCRR